VNPYQNGTHNKERKKKQIKPPPQTSPREDIPPPPEFNPSGGSGDCLIIPKALSRKEADSARQQVAQIRPDQRQAVLDVLAAMIDAGEIRY
jgi:hypothetical protein